MRPLPTRLAASLALLAIGTTWGLTVPLGKIAVEAGHRPAGIIVWELALTIPCLILFCRPAIARSKHLPRFIFVALLGTLLPNSASYLAYDALPAGVMSIVIAAVPMLSLPVALALGLERPDPLRLSGVCLGLFAITLIAAPKASLPDPSAAPWLLVALIPPLCYAIEGNGLALRGSGGLSAAETLLGAAVVGLVIAIPVALLRGQWIALAPWDTGKTAIIALSLLHIAAYTGYIWLISWAGSVFAAQVAYVVTITGVFWSMALLSESYSSWVWAALFVMMAGLALVAPKGSAQKA